MIAEKEKAENEKYVPMGLTADHGCMLRSSITLSTRFLMSIFQVMKLHFNSNPSHYLLIRVFCRFMASQLRWIYHKKLLLTYHFSVRLIQLLIELILKELIMIELILTELILRGCESLLSECIQTKINSYQTHFLPKSILSNSILSKLIHTTVKPNTYLVCLLQIFFFRNILENKPYVYLCLCSLTNNIKCLTD